MSNKISGIYAIRNILNNKVYIGSSIYIKGRWSVHRKSLEKNIHWNIKLQNSYNKYGKENFIYEIVEETDKFELKERESYWINFYNATNNDYGYNISIDTLAPARGFKLSEERKAKLRERMTGEKNPFYGKHHSEETNKANSESHKGEKHNQFGKHPSKESIEKTAKAKWKSVIQFSLNEEFIKEWPSAKQAGIELKINKGNIGAVTRNERKSAGGFIWRKK